MRRWLAMMLCLLAQNGYAQIAGDTLQGLEVVAPRDAAQEKQRYEAGVKQRTIDHLTRQLYRQESLAELLAASTTAFVRATGLNTFSTLSLRGASSAQSAVYWEGVPLMNGATGGADISLLPVSSMRSVTVDYGSSAALWGSGNVGGAILLQDERPLFGNGKWSGEVAGGAGSFGHYSGLGNVRYSGKRLFATVAGSAVRAENDFEVVDERGNHFVTENARQQSYNANLTLGCSPGKKGRDILTGRLWLYGYDRQIPKALFESGSVKRQTDDGFRTMLQWERRPDFSTNRYYAKAALLGNSFSYGDSSIGLYSEVATRQAFAEGGVEKRIGQRGYFTLFAPLQRLWLVRSPDTAQTRAAIAGAVSYGFFRRKLAPQHYRIQAAANFRLESFDGKLIALPGLNAHSEITSGFSLLANAQYTYRAPTLNELYYQPGGNPDLKPERGWSVDGGYDWRKDLSREGRKVHWRFHQSGAVYDRLIRDWIIWLGGSIWTPHNLAAVHSRGIELENSLSGSTEKVNWQMTLNAAYTRSTPTESYLPGDNSVGRQIPYVPLTTLTATGRIGWKGLIAYWNTVVTGYRFVTSDESQRLPGYVLSGLRVAYGFWAERDLYNVQLSLNNIFNERYAVVAYRPMPGFNWSLSAGVRLRNRD